MYLCYGNYGMPKMPVAEMLQKVAEIGYDGLELSVGPGYPSAPDQVQASDLAEMRRVFSDGTLRLAAFLIAKITVLQADDAQHRANLDYLRRVFDLRAALGSDAELSSTLGGKIADWPDQRDLLAERVADWADVAAEYGAVFGFEPHVNGIIDRPDRALWLLRAVNKPSLKIHFDYSHFELINLPLEETMDQLLPYASGVHVKDTSGRPPDFRFLLPGEGSLDYANYLRLLQQKGYDGAVTVEISGQIFNAPGYDPVAAARFSYNTLAAAFRAAGIERRP